MQIGYKLIYKAVAEDDVKNVKILTSHVSVSGVGENDENVTDVCMHGAAVDVMYSRTLGNDIDFVEFLLVHSYLVILHQKCVDQIQRMMKKLRMRVIIVVVVG